MKRLKIVLHDLCNSINDGIIYTTPCLEKIINWNKFNIPVIVEIDKLDMVIGFVQNMELQGPDFVYYVELFNDEILGDTQYVIVPRIIVHEVQYLENKLIAMIRANITNFEIKISTPFKYQVEKM